MKPKSLGELEKQIMDIMWDRHTCSVREVLNHLRKKRQVAYTTVATIFDRLYSKGLLAREMSGITYIYSPKISKSSYSKKVARSFLKKFVSSFGDIAIASFADTIDHLPKNKKEYLLKLLSEYGKSK